MWPDENNAVMNTAVANPNAVTNTNGFTWTTEAVEEYNQWQPRTAYDRYVEQMNRQIDDRITWYYNNDLEEIKRELRRLVDRVITLEVSIYWMQAKMKEWEMAQWFTYIQPDDGDDR